MRCIALPKFAIVTAVVIALVAGQVLAGGLSADDNQLWHQDVAGTEDFAETGDLFGSAAASGDFNGDGFMDLAVGVPSEDLLIDDQDLPDAGVVQVMYGSVFGLSDWDQILSGGSPASGCQFGFAVAAGDFNGDGHDDLAVGVPYASDDAATAGAVRVFYGGESGLTTIGEQFWSQDSEGIGGTADPGDHFGWSLAAGDFDGDGYVDLAVGVPEEGIGAYEDAGALHILPGGPAGLTGIGSQLWYQGAGGLGDVCESSDFFGNALAAGDLNGDGFDDLAVGVARENFGSVVDVGVVHAIYGSLGGLTGDGDQVWSQDSGGIQGATEADDLFGFAVACGDFDGDGYADLAVGVPHESIGAVNDAGVVNVLYGCADGLAADRNQMWSQDSGGIEGLADPDDMFGYAVACGDFDDDGYADLAVGAPGEDITDVDSAGAANVLYGGSGGLSALGNQIWYQDIPGIQDDSEAGDLFGFALACGDFDGSGYEDLAIGAPGEDVASVADAGAVNILFDSCWRYDIGGGLPGVSFNSVAWGDYDNDGDLDILLTGVTGGSVIISRVYRNDAGSFTDIDAGLPGVKYSSVAWGDCDNDGDLDILLTGYTGSARISRVYRNDAGSFTDIDAGLPGVSSSSVAWGDYDNDGDLDILLTGETGSAVFISRVYRNDTGSFTDIGAGLPDVIGSSVAWGDYDNDGDLDILLTGHTGWAYISRVYRNDAGSFTDIGVGLTGVIDGAVAWGDCDNDGDLDILLTGETGSGSVSRVYCNDAGSFTDIGAGLPGVIGSSVAWGDYDNDGDLDILLTGRTDSAYISRVYRNDAGSFVDIDAGLRGVYLSSVAWGDYDNDGDLDILLAGDTDSGTIARLYQSPSAANTPPAVPTNLDVQVVGSSMEFTWDAATDAETPTPGLTYNLRVGTTPGGAELCSALADASSGYRLVPALGNTNHNTSWTIALPEPPPAGCYWSVQAIDTGFAGSAFSAEQVYEGFLDIAAGLPGVSISSVAWGDYDNDGDLDILLTGLTDWADISRVYRNDAGSFTDIDAGLTGVHSSSAAWGDYDNDGDLDILLTGRTSSGSVSRVYRNDAGSFIDIDAGLPGVYISSVAWGDYDNDGDLDILLTGGTGSAYISRVYRNDAGSFTDIDAGLTGVCSSSAAWGDYDNDGDLDILLIGHTDSAVLISRVYRNDAGSFTDIDAGLTGVYSNSAAWGDYDNDGDLDILLTGHTGSAYISRVYRNDAGSFTDIDAGLTGVCSSSAAWGDYDNDGDLDILLTGLTVWADISRVYRNDAGSFTDIDAGLTGVRSSSAAWGDYDNDGDLDILLTGLTDSGKIARVYQSLYAANTPPAAPMNLDVQVVGSSMEFTWDAATDAETPTPGLTYNLRVGTAPGGAELCSALADASSGYRLVPALGNTNHNTSWTITLAEPPPAGCYWSVQAIDTGFAGSVFAAEDVYDPLTGVSEDRLPRAFALGNSAPNPFNPRTTIRYDLAVPARVRLRVYDVAGRLVRTLRAGGPEPAGFHEAVWNGCDDHGRRVSSGTYFYCLEAGEFTETKKMTLLK